MKISDEFGFANQDNDATTQPRKHSPGVVRSFDNVPEKAFRAQNRHLKSTKPRIATPRKLNSELRKNAPPPLTPLIPISPEPPLCRATETLDSMKKKVNTNTDTSSLLLSIPPVTISKYFKKKLKKTKRKDKFDKFNRTWPDVKESESTFPRKCIVDEHGIKSSTKLLSLSTTSSQEHNTSPPQTTQSPIIRDQKVQQSTSSPPIREPDTGPPPLVYQKVQQSTSSPPIREPGYEHEVFSQTSQRAFLLPPLSDAIVSMNSKTKLNLSINNFSKCHQMKDNEEEKIEVVEEENDDDDGGESNKGNNDKKKRKYRTVRKIRPVQKQSISSISLFKALVLGMMAGFFFILQNGMNANLNKEVFELPILTALCSIFISFVLLFNLMIIFHYYNRKKLVSNLQKKHLIFNHFLLRLKTVSFIQLFINSFFLPIYLFGSIISIETLGFMIFQYCLVFGYMMSTLFCDKFGFFKSKLKLITYLRIFCFIITIIFIILSIIEQTFTSKHSSKSSKSSNNQTLNKNNRFVYYLHCLYGVFAGFVLPIQSCSHESLSRRFGTYYHVWLLSLFGGMVVLIIVFLIILTIVTLTKNNHNDDNDDSYLFSTNNFENKINYQFGRSWNYLGGICNVFVIIIMIYAINHGYHKTGFIVSFASFQIIFSFIFDMTSLFSFSKQSSSLLDIVQLIAILCFSFLYHISSELTDFEILNFPNFEDVNEENELNNNEGSCDGERGGGGGGGGGHLHDGRYMDQSFDHSEENLTTFESYTTCESYGSSDIEMGTIANDDYDYKQDG